MSKDDRGGNWHTPDSETDMCPVSGVMLIGRPGPIQLRYYSVRRRSASVSLNWYSRKKTGGVPSYGVTVAPEVAKEVGRKLMEAAELVLRQQGREEKVE